MKTGLKIGIVGKGGVGKTTVTSLLARAYAARGLRVVAVDTDSNPNLGLSLGLDLDATEAIPVLPRSLVVGRRGDPMAVEGECAGVDPLAMTSKAAQAIASPRIPKFDRVVKRGGGNPAPAGRNRTIRIFANMSQRSVGKRRRWRPA